MESKKQYCLAITEIMPCKIFNIYVMKLLQKFSHLQILIHKKDMELKVHNVQGETTQKKEKWGGISGFLSFTQVSKQSLQNIDIWSTIVHM